MSLDTRKPAAAVGGRFGRGLGAGGIALAGLLLAAAPAKAQYSYSTFTYPGASNTSIRGISNNGDLVGKFSGSSNSGGFVDIGGAFYQIAGVGRSVNTSGVAVGYASGQGYVYNNGSYTNLSAPNSVRTLAFGINDSGSIVGTYTLANGNQLGFLDVGGTYTTIAPPNVSSVVGSVSVTPTGINDNGEIAGYYTDANGVGAGFTYVNGVYSEVSVPGSQYTGLLGINDSGTAVGFYANASGDELPLVDSNGVFTFLQVPGQTTDTDATGINDAGTIVGYNTLPNGNSVGFITGPPAVLSSLVGGTPAAPTPLPNIGDIAGVTGSIGGQGSTEFYQLDWSGGAFQATLSLTGANALSSYAFELLNAQQGVVDTTTLSQLDGFSGTLSDMLAAGTYEIGLEANSPYDPDFDLQFVTPVQGVASVPEPASWAVLLFGLGLVGGAARRTRARSPSPA